MINYSKPNRQPSATVAAAVLALPRTPDGRISYRHPNRAGIGAVTLTAGQSVTLHSNGSRTITSADGTSRTVFARTQ